MLNVQSLNNDKILQLETITHDLHDLGFICLSETWLRDENINSVQIRGYTLCTYFCRKTNRGGGVAIWSKLGLTVEVLDFPNFNDEKNFEFCGFRSTLDGTRICVVLCYRSPSGDYDVFLDCLNRLLFKIVNVKCQIILGGDFNINFRNDSRQLRCLFNVMSTFNLVHCVYLPTRVQAFSETTIDNVFTNNIKNISKVGIMDTVISDHRMMLVALPSSGVFRSKEYISFRCFSDENILRLTNMLNGVSWESLFQFNDMNCAFDYFYVLFMECFNECFPVLRRCTNKTNCSKKWVTCEVKRSSDNLRCLYALQKDVPVLKDQYLLEKNKHKVLVRQTKCNYYKKKITCSSNSTKAAWDAIHELSGTTNCKRKENIILQCDGQLIFDPNEVSQLFNNFFIDSVREVVSQIPVCDNNINCSVSVLNSMFTLPYSEYEVRGLFGKLKNKSSSGPDGIPCNLLKRISDYLIVPLTFLINLSLESGIFPEKLKMSSVIPLHKKGSKLDVNNYRPLTMSSSFSKLFEYAMFYRLSSHLDKYKILTEHQHGFRVDHSTMTAIHDFYGCVLRGFDSGEFPFGVFCDLSRAFDCVDHDLLLEKLNWYGVRGVVADWFRSYLGGRSQFVSVRHGANFVESSTILVERGVPQGSILGPILFLIFVNDITDFLPGCDLIMYADDTSAVVSSNSVSESENKVNALLFNINAWFSRNKLFLNADKTKYLIFHSVYNKTQFDTHVLANNAEIERVSSVVFLGLHIDDQLTWRTHCDKLISKLNSVCYQLRTLRTVIDRSSLLSFYYAHVHSRLLYGITFWGASSASGDVFLAQKRIIRCIAGIDTRQSCRPYFKEWKILPLAAVHIFELLLYVYRNKEKFVCNEDIHHYNTRSKLDFHIPNYSLRVTEDSPRILGLRLFNALPHELRMASSLMHFKRVIRAFLLHDTVYSINEFRGRCDAASNT